MADSGDVAESAATVFEPSSILELMRALLPPPERPRSPTTRTAAGAADGENASTANHDDDARIDAGCTIWDLSADAATAAFMREHGVISLLLHPLARVQTTSARLREICCGTLANLAAVDKPACAALLGRDDAADVFQMLLLHSSDAPTLSELLRLLSTLLTAAAASLEPLAVLPRWLRAVGAPACLEAVSFYLANTLRTDVRSRAAHLLSALLYGEWLVARQADEETKEEDTTTQQREVGGEDTAVGHDEGHDEAHQHAPSKRQRKTPEPEARDAEGRGVGSSAATTLLDLGGLSRLSVVVAAQLTRRAQAGSSAGASAEDDAGLVQLLQLLDALAPHAAPSEATDARDVHTGCLAPCLIGACVRMLQAAEPLRFALAAEGAGGEAAPAGEAAGSGGGTGEGGGDGAADDADGSEGPLQCAVADGVRAAWSLLHGASLCLDGFALCVGEAPPPSSSSAAADAGGPPAAHPVAAVAAALSSGGDGGNAPAADDDAAAETEEAPPSAPAAFGCLLSHSKALHRACVWAGHAANLSLGVEPLAKDTLGRILDAASVVITAGGARDALGGARGLEQLHNSQGGIESDEGVFAAGGTPTELVVKSVNELRTALDGQEGSPAGAGGGGAGGGCGGGGYMSDDDEPAVGFGSGLPGSGGGGGGAGGGGLWASLSDDEEASAGSDFDDPALSQQYGCRAG